jgi:hypothetical protein
MIRIKYFSKSNQPSIANAGPAVADNHESIRGDVFVEMVRFVGVFLCSFVLRLDQEGHRE